jgi:hypothetical protein
MAILCFTAGLAGLRAGLRTVFALRAGVFLADMEVSFAILLARTLALFRNAEKMRGGLQHGLQTGPCAARHRV